MRNPKAIHIDFSSLEGVISTNTKALPSNLDFIYERKGNFLVGEFKRGTEKISQGQKILLQSLAKLDQFNVIVINGYSENSELFINTIYWVKPDGTTKEIGNGLDRLKEIINNWYNKAND